MRYTLTVLTLISCAAVLGFAGPAAHAQAGNLGYNSYEGYISGGVGPNNYFGPGVGYGTPSGAFGDYHNAGDYFRRYVPPEQWGKFGQGTGHLGQGYGPYIFSPREGAQRPSLNDPLMPPYQYAPPPKIKVGGGVINVSVPGDLPGVRQVTVTLLAFNGAELCTQSIQAAPFNFQIPVMDGSKNVRVRIDYINDGLSATSYPL